MATLHAIIAAFLDDLTKAQNKANKFSARLSRHYRTHKDLRFFPVPNALLEEADVTLHFSIEAIESVDRSEHGRHNADGAGPPPRIVAADIAAEVATLVLAELRSKIDPDDQTEDRATALELRRQLCMPAVRRALTQNLTSSLQPLLMLDTLDPTRPTRDVETRNSIRDALDLTFGADEDLAAAGGLTQDWTNRLAYGDVGSHAAAALLNAATAGDTRADSVEPQASIHIHLGPHSGDVTQSLLQTVRLRARLRNYKWVVVEEGEPDLDQLVPES